MDQQTRAAMREAQNTVYAAAMKNLPPEKRAAEIKEVCCPAIAPGSISFACTKRKDHPDSLHVAHSSVGVILHEWVEGSANG